MVPCVWFKDECERFCPSFLVQDRVSLLSSRLWAMVLPSSLLSELAEISKLLVSRLQVEKPVLGRRSGPSLTRFSLQSSSPAGRVPVTDDGDRMEEDWDTSTAPRSQQVDLFDEGTGAHSRPSGPSGQKTDSSDTVCGPGVQEPLMAPHSGSMVCQRLEPSPFPPAGAKSLLSEDHLAQQDLALLAVLDFLCECGTVQPAHGLLFKPQEVRRRLLLLLQQVDFSRALHLHMVGGWVGGVCEEAAPHTHTHAQRLANPPLCLPLS